MLKLTDGVLRIGSSGLLAGDYDRDGAINNADYAVWRQQFGSSVTPLSGADGNGNGVIDAADYIVWRKNSGTHTAATAVTAAVPEPGAALLAFFAFSAILHVCRLLRK